MSIFDENYHRHQLHMKNELPNKCDYCGLRISYSGVGLQEDIRRINELQKSGLAQYPARNIDLVIGAEQPASNEFICAINEVKYWNNNNKKCPYWILNLHGSDMKINDYLSIHHTKTNAIKSHIIGMTGAILAFISILIVVH